ncbi:phage holin [Pantoea sp. alder70]|nr:phage holin [Pantoea sp. alder70]MCA1179803.1 class II holin family protein [Pantoea sp. alder69]MCA1253595.1 class II holin family protein [Pantoea sp. alder70]MCA1268289.1 class II holin family protein [Pantoea sp. alder81]
MSKLTTGVAYSFSAGAMLQSILSWLTPQQWSVLSLIIGILLAVMTFCVNFYYKRKLTLAKINSFTASRYPTSKSSSSDH